MREELSEVKQSTSESSESLDNSFKEEMQRAFWRGVSLLDETQSYVGQFRETAAPSGPSSQGEGFSEIPQNVTALKSVIGKITEKDLPKGLSKHWLSEARRHVQWIKEQQVKKRGQLEDLMKDLNDEMALVDFLDREHRRQ